MHHIIETVERIRIANDATIGRNYVDIQDNLLDPIHLEEHLVRDETVRTRMRDYIKEGLSRLEEIVCPYKIPDDLMFFEQYYGGLAIKSGARSLVVYGCGWGENLDYPSIVEDVDGNPQYRDGWLEVGALAVVRAASSDNIPLRAGFWLDLAGTVRPNSIVTNGWYQGLDIWDDPRQALTVVANHFGAWLKQLADQDWIPHL